MDRIIPDCDVRVKISGGAQWRRLGHISWDKEWNPLEDNIYLELNSQPHSPVIVDLVLQRIRILVFPGKFEITKLRDEDALVPKDSKVEWTP